MHTLALIRRGSVVVNLADENLDNLKLWKAKLSSVIHQDLPLPLQSPAVADQPKPPSPLLHQNEQAQSQSQKQQQQLHQQVSSAPSHLAPLPQQVSKKKSKSKLENIEDDGDKASLAPVCIASPSVSPSHSTSSTAAVPPMDCHITLPAANEVLVRKNSDSASSSGRLADMSPAPAKRDPWSTRLKRFRSGWFGSSSRRKDLTKPGPDNVIEMKEDTKEDLVVADPVLVLNSSEVFSPADDSRGQFHNPGCWSLIDSFGKVNHGCVAPRVALRKVVQQMIDLPHVTNWRLIKVENGMRISELTDPSGDFINDTKIFKSMTRVRAPAIAVFELIKQGARHFRGQWDPFVDSLEIEQTLCHSTEIVRLNLQKRRAGIDEKSHLTAVRHTLSFDSKFISCELYLDSVLDVSIVESFVYLWSGFVIDSYEDDPDSCIVQQFVEVRMIPTLSWEWLASSRKLYSSSSWSQTVPDLIQDIVSRVAGIRELFDQSPKLLFELQKISQMSVEMEAASGKSERQLSPLRTADLCDTAELSLKDLTFLKTRTHPIRLDDVELDDFLDGNEFGLPGFVRAFDGGMMLTDRVQVARQRGVLIDIIKQMGKNIVMGKSIFSVTMPVTIFEPRSLLERMTDMWCFAPIFLGQASLTSDPLERFKLVLVFIISGFHRGVLQLKPFNPVLGETFQAFFKDGTSIHLEQVSHHPPVSAYQLFGPGGCYEFHGRNEYVAKLGTNKIMGRQIGPNVVSFPDGVKIEYIMPELQMDGMVFGDRYVNWTGKLFVEDSTNNLSCCVTFNPEGNSSSWFGSSSPGVLRKDCFVRF
eukprot:TRINITY_DN22925_c0_g2_i3.p1 TRINITY_DN22925_c0_g2~~TRINITY_DN22925_c0_g2_i3.p1  ORF type:complete len:912 (-),score=208.11 TRINITY_DN22925_c0_g2_i3:2093-4528(-)